MKPRIALLALAIAGAAGLVACKREAAPDAAPAAAAATTPADETADQFVARVNEEVRKLSSELASAQWLSNTYINSDSEMVAAKANERWLGQLNAWIEQSKRFEGKPMSAETARAIKLLKLWTAMPAPKDPAKLEELTKIATRMEGMYGSGSYCTGEGDAKVCRDIGQLSEVLAKSRDYDAQLEAWQGWHTISKPMRKDYTRFVELVNEGASEMGFADAGEMWRSGYDMSPVELAAETDRLWDQVKPLYEQLHCYTRNKLDAKYGADKGQVAGGMLPAHLMGNLWQQDWGNLWDILQPYQGAGSLDINNALQQIASRNVASELAKPATGAGSAGERSFLAQRAAARQTAVDMTRRAEDFYVSLGMPKLPASYWEKTQFIKPLDRDVVCHASAWDMNMAGDVRTKMCIKPNEEDFTTIYHELGHVYYYLLYKDQQPVFQNGANDGFHEAVGDAVALAITRDVHTSEDIAQEAFLSAWHHLPRLKNPSSFLPWLRQITRNLAHDHLRGRRNRMLDGEAADLAIQHAADPDVDRQAPGRHGHHVDEGSPAQQRDGEPRASGLSYHPRDSCREPLRAPRPQLEATLASLRLAV